MICCSFLGLLLERSEENIVSSNFSMQVYHRRWWTVPTFMLCVRANFRKFSHNENKFFEKVYIVLLLEKVKYLRDDEWRRPLSVFPPFWHGQPQTFARSCRDHNARSLCSRKIKNWSNDICCRLKILDCDLLWMRYLFGWLGNGFQDACCSLFE